jgi:O-antigen biosynthesis protein
MTLLMIDGALPARESSAGERATFDLMEALHALGHGVSFTALGTNGKEQERLQALQAAGITVLPGFGGGLTHLEEVLAQPWDTVIIHRPGPALAAAAPLAASGAVTLHWGHDIHLWRLQAQQSWCGTVPVHKLRLTELVERRCWQAYDLTVYPTAREAEHVAASGGRAAAVPYYRLTALDLPALGPWSSRRGCLMVGAAFHAPNADAVEFAVREILPLLNAEAFLTVVGEWPAEQRAPLQGPRVHFTGRVSEEELRRLHAEHLCLLAPLRFGAGARRKLVAAMGLGLPVLTTHEGLRGLLVRDAGPTDGVLIAATGAQFAQQIAALQVDPGLHAAGVAAASAAVAAVYSQGRFDAAVSRTLELAREKHDVR